VDARTVESILPWLTLESIIAWLAHIETNRAPDVPKQVRKGLKEYVSPYDWEFLTTTCLEAGDEKHARSKRISINGILSLKWSPRVLRS